MSSDHRQSVIIQRAICFLVAGVGVILLWASVSHAATAVSGLSCSIASPITNASIPDPATLLLLTAGIGCVFLKMRRTAV